MTYRPQPNAESILNYSLKLIQSVPYDITLRWLYYRLVQDGLLEKSKRDMDRLKNWTLRARKGFWNGWNPMTLNDDTRNAIIRGLPRDMIPAEPDRILPQKNYIEIWYEAHAMTRQFWYYTKDKFITLVPFHGDAGIHYKWKIAKRLEERHDVYHKPIIILYFGDCDKKGQMIPRSALKDITKWCSADFTFVHCGLTLEQTHRFNLSDNPERPGSYQWESLSEEQAESIIMDNLMQYWTDT